VARLASALALLTLFVIPISASAGTPLKTARSGAVSMRVPAAWKLTTQTGSVALVAASRRAEGGFHANVTVVAGQVRGNASVEAWRRQIVSGLRALPTGGGKLTSRIVRLPAGRAVEVSLRGAGPTRNIRFLIYAIDAGRKAYVATFTAGSRVWSRYGALFKTLARSVRIRR
jgi:hypothetical protein